MTKLHQRLLAAVRERFPDYQPSPASPERLAETEVFARDLALRGHVRFPLPDDYMAFLRELGRVPWPMDVGSVLEFRANDWPTAFVVFARDAKTAHGFLLQRRSEGRDDWPTVKDLEERAEQIEWSRAEGWRAEAAAARQEAKELEAREAELYESERTTKDLRIEAVSLATRELREFDPEDGDELSVFADWLEFQIDSAEQREKSAAQAPAATTNDDAAFALQRVLDLFDQLVAMELMEVGDGFDEEDCARRLVAVSDDAGRLLEALVDLPDVEEVFASEDDIEGLLEKMPYP